MLASPFKSLTKGLSNYVESAVRNAGKHVNVAKSSPAGSRRRRQALEKANGIVADTWLEYSFGWMPFISDIGDLLNAINEVKNERPQTNRVRGYGTTEATLNLNDGIIFCPFSNYIWFIKTEKELQKCTVIYTVGEAYTIKKEVNPITETASRFGFNAREILPTVWELIPYSFLVDYVTNVGDIIEAGATSTEFVTFVSKTVIKEAKLCLYASNPSNAQLRAWNQYAKVIYQTGEPGHMEILHRTVNRNPSSLSVPSLEFSFDGLSIKKLANVAALVMGSAAFRNLL